MISKGERKVAVPGGGQAEPFEARAKVNLTLHVEGKRPDGYHELESLVVFADICDEVSFEPCTRDRVTLTGPFASAVEGENLVLKAKRALSSFIGIDQPGHFTVVKNIPVAAGLGGGSSDAAAAIRALLAAYGQPSVIARDFAALSSEVGADVPVCLHGKAAYMRGLGERITPATGFPELPALLVNPRVTLATREVFQSLKAPHCRTRHERNDADDIKHRSWSCVEDVAASVAEGRNDLELAARSLRPVISEVLSEIAQLEGCFLSRLSGSGPTCFGLFRTDNLAHAAEETLRKRRPAWWMAATALS